MLATVPAPPVMDNAVIIHDVIKTSYRRTGHTLLRGLATTDEAELYRDAIAEAVQRYKTENRPLEERDTYGKAFLQITNLWTRDETVRRFSLARRFAGVAAQLMGVDRVRIYHDQALFKEPGGGPTPWHQDQFYWPVDTDKTITMWMPLVDVPVEMGALTFASGSHLEGYLCPLAISDQSALFFEKLVAERAFPVVSSAMKGGDATFHSGWCLHKAPGNKTDRMREVMTVIYYADGASIVEPDSKERLTDLRAWFPGCRPGEPAESELNPLVYEG